MPETVFNCPDCESPMELGQDKYGRAYLCTRPGCRGRHSVHQVTGLPMGVPADARVRRLRSEAHEVFDRIWKTKKMTRSQAYAWMIKKMVVHPDNAHIGQFTAEQCRHLEREVRADFPDLFLEIG